MKKTPFLFCCLLLAVSLSFISCDDSKSNSDNEVYTPPVVTTATVIVVNESSYTIDVICASLSTEIDFGPDLLNTLLYYNDTFTLYNIPPGTYDLYVEAITSDYIIFWDQLWYAGYDYTYTIEDAVGSYRDSDTAFKVTMEKTLTPEVIEGGDVDFQK